MAKKRNKTNKLSDYKNLSTKKYAKIILIAALMIIVLFFAGAMKIISETLITLVVGFIMIAVLYLIIKDIFGMIR